MTGKTLGYYVRLMRNLYRAFVKVRTNVRASGRAEFRADVTSISKNPIPYLRRIQRQLQEQRFSFDKQKGVPITKPDGRVRPIVVASIRNRIVQRAVLNVLQCEHDPIVGLLGDVPSALRTPTSVGGVPGKGVPSGIKIVRDAIRDGATYYLRSDIRDFFTRVPKPRVIEFVKSQTSDREFIRLLEHALATELENADEVKEWIQLFPQEDIGVPQGSSLSAVAGNIVLHDFDKALNGRGITTIRYIDDFVILGPSAKAVRKAFSSASGILTDFGMTAYQPDDGSGKSMIGPVSDGFEFLGCSIRNNRVAPSRDAAKSLLKKVSDALREGERSIKTFASENCQRRAEETFAQALVRVDRIVRGWGDSLAFVDDRLSFHHMDTQITEELRRFTRRANRLCKHAASDDKKRRSLGIALLKDTPRLSAETD